jgi:dedicated sortase system histidine kinase
MQTSMPLKLFMAWVTAGSKASFTMNLRRQLLLVSLLTLVLPWAGCQFVRETETALKTGQQKLLSGTAMAIADSLSQFPREFLDSGDGKFSEDQIYGHTLSSTPLIDGYFDDWPLGVESLRNLRGPDGAIRFVFGVNGQHVYVYVDVRDASIAFTTADRPPASADHVTLVTADDGGTLSSIVFAAEAPGSVQAMRIVDGDRIPDSRMVAYWQDTAAGYRLEARIPLKQFGTYAGIEVHNASGDKTVVSRSFSRGAPGKFISESAVLRSAASNYAQPGMRLLVTNRSGWRLAQAGDLSVTATENQYSMVPSGWQLIAYRVLLEQGKEALLAEPDPSGREQQHYVAMALNSEASTSWFRNAETGRAVIAVAQPIWSGTVQTGALILQQDTEAILSLTNEALMRLITLTIVATVGAAAALLGYASWLSLRVRRLSHAADHALDTDQPSTALPSADAADEIGDLSRSFSSVLQQLATYNEYLRSLASKLSHELRTPLTIVTSSLENLDHEPLSEQSREYTERARSGAERLKKILNAMSESNRVEQLMENADTELFDLRKVLEATTAAYADAWPDRRFVLNVDESEHRVDGSPELIVQMLDKLIDNAVDFSEVNDEITVDLSRSNDEISLSVTNPGPPLPKSMRNRLFESMVSVRPDAGGDNLGLGLNIAKLIADGHGGSIHAENTEGGVRFDVRLPAA